MHGMHEHVRDPTRGDYLLDLVTSDLNSDINCKFLPEINDQRIVLSNIKVRMPTAVEHTRLFF